MIYFLFFTHFSSPLAHEIFSAAVFVNQGSERELSSNIPQENLIM